MIRSCEWNPLLASRRKRLALCTWSVHCNTRMRVGHDMTWHDTTLWRRRKQCVFGGGALKWSAPMARTQKAGCGDTRRCVLKQFSACILQENIEIVVRLGVEVCLSAIIYDKLAPTLTFNINTNLSRWLLGDSKTDRQLNIAIYLCCARAPVCVRAFQ